MLCQALSMLFLLGSANSFKHYKSLSLLANPDHSALILTPSKFILLQFIQNVVDFKTYIFFPNPHFCFASLSFFHRIPELVPEILHDLTHFSAFASCFMALSSFQSLLSLFLWCPLMFCGATFSSSNYFSDILFNIPI